MHILIVSHYYPPEVGAPQARLSELAGYWVALGATVTVITGMPNHPSGVVPAEYKGALTREEDVRGVRVLRNWLYATANEQFLKKTLGHLSFMLTAVVLGAPRINRPDVVLVSSPTFFSVFSAWLIARVYRARLVVEVRDLWPAIFVELGVLKNRLLINALERLELAAYTAADAVVVVTDGFRDNLIKRGVRQEKVTTITNGVDVEFFSPILRPNPVDRELLGGTDSDVLVLYMGAHGISQGLQTVVEAAEILQHERVRFALVGEGADKRNVANRIQKMRIKNVSMLPSVPRVRVPSLIAAADLCLVPLRRVPLFDTFLPSKMFEFLSMGVPVIGSLSGEAARILEAAGCDVVSPENAASLAAAIRRLAASSELRKEQGDQGRKFVLANFDRRRQAKRYHALLESVVRGSGES